MPAPPRRPFTHDPPLLVPTRLASPMAMSSVLSRPRRRPSLALCANASASDWAWGQAGDDLQVSRAPPRRHWRSYGNDVLPSGAEALDEPFAAFPAWFIRVTCERCGQERMFSEAHDASSFGANMQRHGGDPHTVNGVNRGINDDLIAWLQAAAHFHLCTVIRCKIEMS